MPASCNVSIDFRVIKIEHTEKIIKKIGELACKYQATANIIEKIDPFLDKIEFLNEIKTSNFMTEASKITNCSKRIILGTGPVTAHEVNENISVDSYRTLVNQYEKLIYKMCQ